MSSTQTPISSSCGFKIVPTSKLLDYGQLDYVAVVGGLLYRGRSLDATTQAYLAGAAKAGLGLVGICTGSFVLCRAGLMRARKCCISWFHYRDFVEEFGDFVPIADQMYVVDDNRITSSGGLGAALTAAYLIERHLSADLATKAMHIMQISKPRSMLQPAPPSASTSDDERITRALLLMEQNIRTPMSVRAIAARTGISKRTLQRLFRQHIGMSPLKAYANLRLRHARWMLHSSMALKAVAEESGFSSNAQLCKAYTRRFGCTPAEDRKRVRTSEGPHRPLVATDDARRIFDAL